MVDQMVPKTLTVITWLVIAFGAGWWYRRLPLERLCHDGTLLRLRRFEAGGDFYERYLHIKRWKSRLPETGGLWGGMSKRRLPGHTRSDLERFAAECRRGERTHWAIVALSPVFLLWHGMADVIGLALANAAGNSPFIAILRYNRARIAGALLRHKGQRPLDQDGHRAEPDQTATGSDRTASPHPGASGGRRRSARRFDRARRPRRRSLQLPHPPNGVIVDAVSDRR